ncbi:branched-chain alpha-keto acid dehydrogenase subunit E2 [Azoarcus sp. DD4]|uniref:2-oxo acid dehydrogenase subunit E2 n=1 Tax=Azoarcus sp. DD4 TaxID=2027405 RepID=UPI0011275171|nr:2-oxo acid dehydrogenase subunit E2 [Azoarcus sp. DD4]QDF95807.1 branched-chain alpha-keto acid dehydrogenase subunit E2 [Azoarcus sp. DD4]
MTTLIEVTVPDIGDYSDVPVIDLLVRVGDAIRAEDAIVTLESDKATMDVPSPLAGIVREIAIAPGDRVSRGTLLLRVEDAAANVVPTAQAGPTALPPAPAETGNHLAAPSPAPTLPANRPPPAGAVRAHASPSVRRLARELGVDLARVAPADAKGRISKDDVIAHVKMAMLAGAGTPAPATAAAPFDLLPWPNVDYARFGPVERRPRTRIQKLSAANLHRNWVLMPHVTNFDEADITDLEAFRQQLNAEAGKEAARLTLLPFLIKAAVHSLQRYPAFNASLDGDEIVEKRYWHIGFAADTPNGLVVPVIRDADRKPLREIAAECAELAALARDGKLRPEQMQGGCFTVSSLGGIGGTGFTPIINAPEVAILGVTRSAIKPVWNGREFLPRRMLPLCLSWDHRAVDGAAAARFLVHLAALLADFRRVVL